MLRNGIDSEVGGNTWGTTEIWRIAFQEQGNGVLGQMPPVLSKMRTGEVTVGFGKNLGGDESDKHHFNEAGRNEPN